MKRLFSKKVWVGSFGISYMLNASFTIMTVAIVGLVESPLNAGFDLIEFAAAMFIFLVPTCAIFLAVVSTAVSAIRRKFRRHGRKLRRPELIKLKAKVYDRQLKEHRAISGVFE